MAVSDKSITRKWYESWYVKRFSSDLDCGHAYGAWYGWMEGYEKGKIESRKEITELKERIAELEAK